MHTRIVKYSMNINATVICEIMRYCMHKYKLSYKDWYSSSCIVKKWRMDFFHIGYAIRELCESRDGGILSSFTKDQCLDMVKLPATSNYYVVVFNNMIKYTNVHTVCTYL